MPIRPYLAMYENPDYERRGKGAVIKAKKKKTKSPLTGVNTPGAGSSSGVTQKKKKKKKKQVFEGPAMGPLPSGTGMGVRPRSEMTKKKRK